MKTKKKYKSEDERAFRGSDLVLVLVLVLARYFSVFEKSKIDFGTRSKNERQNFFCSGREQKK